MLLQICAAPNLSLTAICHPRRAAAFFGKRSIFVYLYIYLESVAYLYIWIWSRAAAFFWQAQHICIVRGPYLSCLLSILAARWTL